MRKLLSISLLLIAFGAIGQRSNTAYYLMAADTSSPTPPPSSTKYDTVLDRATTAGDSLPSAGVQTVQRTFLEAVEGFKLDVLYNWKSDAMAFAYYNQMNPDSNLATNVGGVIFLQDSGFIARGNNMAINLNYDPSTDATFLKEDSVTALFWMNGVIKDNDLFYGGNSGRDMNAKYSGDSVLQVRINATVSTTITLDEDIEGQSGLLAIRLIGSDYDIFWNGTNVGSGTRSGGGSITDVDLYVISQNNGGASTTVRYAIGLAAIGGHFTDTDIADFNTAAQTAFSP